MRRAWLQSHTQKLVRKLGNLQAAQLVEVERAVAQWLGLEITHPRQTAYQHAAAAGRRVRRNGDIPAFRAARGLASGR